MIIRAPAVALWLLACCRMALGETIPNAGCSVQAFETNPSRAAEACTAILHAAGLSDRARAEALKIRARSFHSIGRLDEAIRDYEAALLLAPDDPELHLRRGWTAFDKRDFELVFRQAEQALTLKPGYASAYDLIGAVLADPNVRRFDEARAAFSEAIRSDPGEPFFRYHLFQLLGTWGSPVEAMEPADALLRLPGPSISKPNAVEYYGKKTSIRTAVILERARLLASLGRIAEAKQGYDQAVQDDPGALTFAWRATFQLERSVEPQPTGPVQADLDRSLAADADYWFSQGLAGRVHFYSKNYDAAASEFARAVELYPINGTMRWWHATTLRMIGRSDDAAAEAVTAFQVDPGFMFSKVPTLQKYGFLAPLPRDADPRPALYDAARACMLDDQCW